MPDKYYVKLSLSLMDLTSLNDNDTDEIVHNLCVLANTPYGQTAALCIYPRFVNLAVSTLEKNYAKQVKVATVANFPNGSDDVKQAKKRRKQP